MPLRQLFESAGLSTPASLSCLQGYYSNMALETVKGSMTTNCAFQTVLLASLFSSHAYVNEDASLFDKKKRTRTKTTPIFNLTMRQ